MSSSDFSLRAVFGGIQATLLAVFLVTAFPTSAVSYIIAQLLVAVGTLVVFLTLSR
ncbi:hypothetical protein ACFPYI_01110 [Halomarina salina]|uniref:Uncharacterized protein n=1 Tax=Halomarina salina TaxID=1872699 RepID=A0ABD5RIB3_9EURY|nr:hypothetical protein [Halomarina salina]